MTTRGRRALNCGDVQCAVSGAKVPSRCGRGNRQICGGSRSQLFSIDLFVRQVFVWACSDASTQPRAGPRLMNLRCGPGRPVWRRRGLASPPFATGGQIPTFPWLPVGAKGGLGRRRTGCWIVASVTLSAVAPFGLTARMLANGQLRSLTELSTNAGHFLAAFRRQLWPACVAEDIDVAKTGEMRQGRPRARSAGIR